MNFKRVLHPEIVLDRRGDEFQRKLYREICSGLQREGEWQEELKDGVRRGGYVWRTPKLFEQLDEFARQHFIMMKRFRSESRKIYHVGKDFIQALSQIDRNLPVELLPDKFFAYVSFPLDALHDGDDAVAGAYVAVDTPRNLGFGTVGLTPDTKVIWVSYMTNAKSAIGSLLVEPTETKISEMLGKLRTRDYLYGMKASNELCEERVVVFRAIINALLYINSMDPELHKLLPENSLTKSQYRKAKATESVTDCTVPVILVNQQYQRKRVYSVDSTWVDTYLRIQRCGPGLTKYKFVWVSEHERHFSRV